MITPALRDRIIELALASNPPRHIALKLGGAVDVADVTRIVCQARDKGLPIPRFRARNGARGDARTVVFAVEAVARLAPYAERRAVSVNVLVRRLVDALLDDNLIDAVLDDG